MVVAGHNGNGEPDFFFCYVSASAEEINNGDHYDKANNAAIENGYDNVSLVAFDEHDGAGKSLMDLFVWETASSY